MIDYADLPDTLARDAAPALDDLAAVPAAPGGNVSEAAQRLGVDRTTVHRRLRGLVGSPQG